MDLALRLEVDGELGAQLGDLHVLVDLEVAVLATHRTVQQLVEVDEAVLVADAHLQQVLLDLCLVVEVLPEAERLVLVALVLLAELLEEIEQHLLLDALAAVLLPGESDPHFHEALQVLLELDDHVLLGQVVLLELLDDDQDEQVEHDVRDHHNEENFLTTEDPTITSPFIGHFENLWDSLG